ncbi:hypothetical protein JVU11DRAFT_10023 [Chiua virens]|nr:hypothetical protein JVU11DRAFT_10023 [Chiua virens]
MDQYHRTVLAAEEKFFNECNIGNVPVLLLFTKCDALLVQAIASLTEEEELPHAKMVAKGEQYAESMLKNNPAWELLQSMKYPPKGYVQLKDLQKSEEGCQLLLERTVMALNEEALQKLLVTTQQTNIMLCIEYALRR